MDKLWLKNYPPGIPAEVDVHEFSSVREVCEAVASALQTCRPYSNMGAAMSYAELDQHSRDFRRLPAELARARTKGERAGCDHDAQRCCADDPVARLGACAPGLVVDERQSAVHGARAGAIH